MSQDNKFTRLLGLFTDLLDNMSEEEIEAIQIPLFEEIASRIDKGPILGRRLLGFQMIDGRPARIAPAHIIAIYPSKSTEGQTCIDTGDADPMIAAQPFEVVDARLERALRVARS